MNIPITVKDKQAQLKDLTDIYIYIYIHSNGNCYLQFYLIGMKQAVYSNVLLHDCDYIHN